MVCEWQFGDSARSSVFHGIQIVFAYDGADKPILDNRRASLEIHLREFCRPRNVRRHFMGIGIDPQRQLVLVSGEGTRWPLQSTARRRDSLITKRGLCSDPASRWLRLNLRSTSAGYRT